MATLADTFAYTILIALDELGAVATNTSLGIFIETALAVAATATGGPSGKSIVALEKPGEHHFARLLFARRTEPSSPVPVVNCVSENFPDSKSAFVSCALLIFTVLVRYTVAVDDEGIGFSHETVISTLFVEGSRKLPGALVASAPVSER